jgi:hypothetical protein
MNEDLGVLLREGLDRLTEDAAAPPGLAGRVRSRHRHRQVAIRAAAAATALVSAAAAAAAVTAAGAGPPGAGTGTIRAQTAALVVRQVDRALTGVINRGQVMEARTSGGLRAGPNGTIEASWSYGDSGSNVTAFGAGGYHYEAASGILTVTVVDRQEHTWSRTSVTTGRRPLPGLIAPVPDIQQGQFQAGLRGCASQDGKLTGLLTVSWPSYLHAMLACGAFEVSGPARLNGASVIKLVSARTARGLPAAETLWVSRSSYLPVRIVVSPAPAQRNGGPPATATRTDFRWLPPTAANVARTQVTVPRGFRRVPWPR